MSKGLPSSPISLWDQSAAERAAYPQLESDAVADVAIIGGGYTGCSTALHLAEAGVDCIVLEAEKIGFGGSGRNGGLVNAGLWLPPQDITARLGQEEGSKLVTTLGEAPALVFSLIEKHQIQCELMRAGTLHAAKTPSGVNDLERRADGWKRLGAPVDMLNRQQTAEMVGTSVFHGALLDHRAGSINPMGYARGLARAASNAGARLHTGSRVTGLTQQGTGWQLQTAHGGVSAPVVLLATNAYSDDLWPGISKAFNPIHYFQVATKPLGAVADAILPGRQPLWDTGKIMTSVRKDAFGRLIVGSMGQLFGKDASVSRRWAVKAIRRTFPELPPVELEAWWHGQIAMTGDHIPRLFQLAPNLYAPMGYNGRGIAPGTAFGRAMAAHLAGGAESDLPLQISEFAPEPLREPKRVALDLAMKAYRLMVSL
ncbi:MAG: FAD-binding oxidoreductase [Alphaproteobacteria bacterium]|nr:FAD-binding oxidoreductase [Alphaproteobacteria bacterium]